MEVGLKHTLLYTINRKQIVLWRPNIFEVEVGFLVPSQDSSPYGAVGGIQLPCKSFEMY